MSGASKFTGGFDVNTVNFLTEVYDKEFLTRLRWFEKNFEKVYECRAPEHIPKKGKILYEEIVKRRLQDRKNSPYYVRIHPPHHLPKPDPNVEILPPMRPVPTEEASLLKDGSCAFLTARYRSSPKKRFYFPESSNWIYGWMTDETPRMDRIFGRKNIIRQTFYRRNGVHPEKPHCRETVSHNFDFPFI